MSIGQFRLLGYRVTVKVGWNIDRLTYIFFIPVHPIHPHRKIANDDAEVMDQIAQKHSAPFSTGMNRMNGDEEDKNNEINKKPMNGYGMGSLAIFMERWLNLKLINIYG